MKQVRVRIEGARPLLMHNGALADKLNPWVRRIKLITAKPAKQRTDADEEELARLEFQGGLWYDDVAARPVIPAEAIEGCIRDGARAERKGKDSECSVVVSEVAPVLLYDGPRNRDQLWTHEADGRRAFVDRRGAGVQRSRVMRTRPRFDSWAVEFGVEIDETVIEVAAVKRALANAGAKKGLGDFRPRFGLFAVTRFG